VFKPFHYLRKSIGLTQQAKVNVNKPATTTDMYVTTTRKFTYTIKCDVMQHVALT